MPRGVTAFAFYLALAVAFTWPLAVHLPTAVPDFGDPLLNASILDWVGHGLTHEPLALFDAPMYYPARHTLAFSENMTGIALVVLPFHLAGLSAVTVYNIALLLGFAFAGFGAFVLARVITRNTSAALIAGIIHAFASFKIAHVQHLQIVWSGWLPLLLAALLVYWRRPDAKRAALLGGAFLMNGLTNIHWLLFGGFALVVTIVFLQFAEPRRDRAFWIRLAVGLGIASLLLLPFLVPYSIVANEYGARRTTGEARLGSATPLHWLVASSRSILYGRFFSNWRTDERELFPGFVAIALILVGLWSGGRSGRRTEASGRSGGRSTALDLAIVLFAVVTIIVAISGRITIGTLSIAGADVPAVITTILLLVRFAPWLRARVQSSRFTPEEMSAALWIVIGFLGSLGWNFFLHPFLFRVITPFRATRTPARWAAVALVGIAVWAAIGAAALLARRHAKTRRILGAMLFVLALIDVAARMQWNHVAPQPPAVYRWLAGAKPRSAIELPLVGEGIPFLYLLGTTTHRVPLLNGTSGFETPAHERLRLLEQHLQYGDAFLHALQPADVVIVHEARLSDEQKTALAPLLARLRLVRRFGSDVIYATTHFSTAR